MEVEILELQKRNEMLIQENEELKSFKTKYNSAKQSLERMSSRLRKLCKRLESTHECTAEMRKIADEIRDYTKTITK